MDNNTQTPLRDDLIAIYRSLPEKLRDAIVSHQTSDVYDRMKESYQLTDKQREVLSTQTGLLMMGLRKPQDFVTVLTTMMNIPREKVSFIAQEINRDIFNPLKDSLKEIHALKNPVTPRTPDQSAPIAVDTAAGAADKMRSMAPSTFAQEIKPPRIAPNTTLNSAASPSPFQSQFTPSLEVAPIAQPITNILEQKLGGTFSVKPTESLQRAEPVVPPASTPSAQPKLQTPPAPPIGTTVAPPPLSPAQLKAANDAYREAL